MRRSPLTPIFDEEPRRGSIIVGNTPGWTPPMIDPTGATVTVTPGTLTLDMAIPVTGATVGVTPGTLVASATGALYSAMLVDALALWSFDESSGQPLDQTANGNDMTSFSGGSITYQNHTDPDGVARATLTGRAILGDVSSAIYTGIETTGLTFVHVNTAFTGGTLFGQDGQAGAETYFRVYHDGASSFYVWFGRTTGAAHRVYEVSISLASFQAVTMTSIYIADPTTLPVVKFDGASQTVSLIIGPNGTIANDDDATFYVAGYRAGNYTGDKSLLGVYAGNHDLTSIEAAAVSEGWY